MKSAFDTINNVCNNKLPNSPSIIYSTEIYSVDIENKIEGETEMENEKIAILFDNKETGTIEYGVVQSLNRKELQLMKDKLDSLVKQIGTVTTEKLELEKQIGIAEKVIALADEKNKSESEVQ